MIARREYAYPRLEVEFRVLVGELIYMEDDFREMSLEEFLKHWIPERAEARLMLRFTKKGPEDGKVRETRSNKR